MPKFKQYIDKLKDQANEYDITISLKKKKLQQPQENEDNSVDKTSSVQNTETSKPTTPDAIVEMYNKEQITQTNDTDVLVESQSPEHTEVSHVEKQDLTEVVVQPISNNTAVEE